MKKKPSAWFFVLGGGLMTAGVAGFVFFLVSAIGAMEKSFERVMAPGAATLHLEEPGAYTIFHEYHSVMDGRVYSNPESLPTMDVVITSLASGSRAPISPASGNSTYSVGSRKGVSMLQFSIDQPGDYSFSFLYAGGGSEPQAVMAVSHDFMKSLFIAIFTAVGILLCSLAVGIIIIVITVVKRQQASPPPLPLSPSRHQPPS